ncbi:hypothetical protein PYW08_016474 [Mythimna loreyi]|uniref:Uncharacterized protein n=1 Tax=Mythimna loreyi TaxID=667449 RepID=A0ACC2R2B6_9NEOP|nr:hypothetical protein PYW08_016474 [Mythimna loreyi]
MDFKIVLFVFACVIGTTLGEGLRCYACGFSSVDSDRDCLTITNDTRTVECPHLYCTILRQEFLDPVGQVASFARGCESQPDFLNHEVTDSTFRTFYRACTTDLCNIGNGIQSVTGGNLSPTPEYNGINLLVPGTGDAANIKISLVMLLLSIFVINII